VLYAAESSTTYDAAQRHLSFSPDDRLPQNDGSEADDDDDDDDNEDDDVDEEEDSDSDETSSEMVSSSVYMNALLTGCAGASSAVRSVTLNLANFSEVAK